MSASDHLNGEQLRMFIPAKELKSYNPNPYDYESEAEYHREGAYEWDSSLGYQSGETDAAHHERLQQAHPFSIDQFWQTKYDEAEESGVADSVEQEGVKRPVNIYHGAESSYGTYGHALPQYADEEKPMLAHGHHRVVSAAESDPEHLIPVRHFQGDFGTAVTRGQ